MGALRARARLIARDAGRCTNLASLGERVAGLPEGVKGFLVETVRLREMVDRLAALQTRLDSIDRPILREPLAAQLRAEIENFQHRVAGFHEPLATEFRKAATSWLELADRQLAGVHRITQREPTPQVFRAGDPVDRALEAFVHREQIVERIAQQVMLASGCPGLVLYGRRRMGKTTILLNLPGFLPPEVQVATISLQNPSAHTSLSSFVQLLARSLRAAWPRDDPSPQAKQDPADLPELSGWLERMDQVLRRLGQRLIFGIDEYEIPSRKNFRWARRFFVMLPS
jgi:hypothetical protein